MKSYNVKSNAKRFARGIAAKYPGMYEASEPHHAPGGEWFPAVCVLADKFAFVSDDVRAVCIIANEDPGELVVSFPHLEGDAEPAHVPAEIDVRDFGARGSIFDAGKESISRFPKIHATLADAEKAEPLVFSPETIASRPELTEAAKELGIPVPEMVTLYKGQSAGKSASTLAEMAAAIPPTPKRTREEIDAARAERRARIEREKADGTRNRAGERVVKAKKSKKQIIIELISREDGATQAELESATEWQRHTLRGYIAGTLRKLMAPLGKVIECERGSGDVPTRYYLTTKKEG